MANDSRRPGSRAQSESVGVVLLTVVVVLSVTTVGTVVFAQVQGTETTRADLAVTVARDGVTVTHAGGDSIPLPDLVVVVRNDSDTLRPTVTAAGVVQGDDDATFDPGERWASSRSLGEDLTTVFVVDTRTNAVLTKVTRYPTDDSS